MFFVASHSVVSRLARASVLAAALAMVQACAGARAAQYVVIHLSPDGQPGFVVDNQPREAVVYVGVSVALPGPAPTPPPHPLFLEIACGPGGCNPPDKNHASLPGTIHLKLTKTGAAAFQVDVAQTQNAQ
jgi:hypothetical protein